ncbi:MAG: hypothetical protein QOK25_1833 [Thermoleophilaceae bacterium]|nr:hypothetical protein [Thermoleophilaceae bacterium]
MHARRPILTAAGIAGSLRAVNELKLYIIEGPNAGQDLDVERPAVIGRDPASAGLTLTDPEASRRHASVIPEGQALNIEDLGSTNGTFVNGERIDSARVLVRGDRLRIGTTVMEVAPAGSLQGTPAASAHDGDQDFAQPDTAESAAPPLAAVSGGSPEQPPGAPPPPEDPVPGAGSEPPPEPAYAPPPPPATPVEAPPGGPLTTQPGTAMQTRDSIVEWLLSAFVPFYSLYWFYRANKEMEAWSGGRIPFNATNSILALTLGWIVIIPPFVAWASYMARIREAQRMAGLPQTASFGGSVLRAFLLSYNIKWHQDQFNEIAVRQPQA